MPSIPTTMRAARATARGDAERLHVARVPVPVPRADEVLVRVHAAGLNPKDAQLRRRGRARRGTGFDFAGEVVATGAEVRDLEPGARVMGFLDGTRGGTAAEYVAVPRRWLASAPRALRWTEAAAVPLVGTAALQALRDVARVRRGERVLVTGATGGVGLAAVQIARALGAHVIAVARPEHADAVRALGAECVSPSIEAVATSHGVVDVVLECAGGAGARSHHGVLAPGGRWVAVAPDVGVFVRAPFSRLAARWFGTTRYGFVIVHPEADDLATIARLCWEGALRMPVAATWPLEGIVDAHRALERRGLLGKRVVAITAEAAA